MVVQEPFCCSYLQTFPSKNLKYCTFGLRVCIVISDGFALLGLEDMSVTRQLKGLEEGSMVKALA